mgnify:CR=1 FL=1
MRDLPARATEPGAFPADVPELIRQRLALVGVTGLYEHQRAAFEVARSGAQRRSSRRARPSGKTLVYNLAFATARGARPQARRRCTCSPPRRWRATSSVRCASSSCRRSGRRVYDGDTPRAERPADPQEREPGHDEPGHARTPALLPDHRPLGRLPPAAVARRRRRDPRAPRRLRVARRAHRAAAAPAAGRALRRRPALVLACATVGNPGRARRARSSGEPFEAVADDRSPSGGKTLRAVEPADRGRGVRRAQERAHRHLVPDGPARRRRVSKSIGFARSRRAAELLAEFTRRGARRRGSAPRVKAYRAGLPGRGSARARTQARRTTS